LITDRFSAKRRAKRVTMARKLSSFDRCRI
jgi:hypothetical protein